MAHQDAQHRHSSTGANRRRVVTAYGKVVATMSHSPPQWRGWVPPRELMQQGRGVSPRRMMVPPCRCQSIKCPYPRTGTGVRVRSVLERGVACSRDVCTLERGGARSREVCTVERGGARSRVVCTLERGGACSRGPLSGPPWWAAGATAAWAVPSVRA
jgi:hypothetical protein